MPEQPLDLPIIEVAGSPAQMGQAFGEACRDGARELFEVRVNAALEFAGNHGRQIMREQLLDVCRRCVAVTESFDPEGFEEYTAIARAIGLSDAEFFALNGLTDLRDVLGLGDPALVEGCTSFILGRDRSADGRLWCGQNWDLATTNMPFVRLVHRIPDHAPETWSVTTAGCLSLIGINSEGVAVGNTNLRTNDARIGVQYLSVIHRALRSGSFDEAVAVVRDAPRAGAHYYYVAGPEGKAYGAECSATRCVPTQVTAGTFVHCNHALFKQVAQFEVPNPQDTTHFRQQRMTELLTSHDGPIGVDDLRRFLSDREGGERGINRYHTGPGVSTNASVLMCPETRQIHACCGQPDRGVWVTRQMARVTADERR